jgi:hypothetical protein
MAQLIEVAVSWDESVVAERAIGCRTVAAPCVVAVFLVFWLFVASVLLTLRVWTGVGIIEVDEISLQYLSGSYVVGLVCPILRYSVYLCVEDWRKTECSTTKSGWYIYYDPYRLVNHERTAVCARVYRRYGFCYCGVTFGFTIICRVLSSSFWPPYLWPYLDFVLVGWLMFQIVKSCVNPYNNAVCVNAALWLVAM